MCPIDRRFSQIFRKNIVREIFGFALALQHAAGERLHTRGISHVQFVECLAIALSEPLQNQFIRFFCPLVARLRWRNIARDKNNNNSQVMKINRKRIGRRTNSSFAKNRGRKIPPHPNGFNAPECRQRPAPPRSDVPTPPHSVERRLRAARNRHRGTVRSGDASADGCRTLQGQPVAPESCRTSFAAQCKTVKPHTPDPAAPPREKPRP